MLYYENIFTRINSNQSDKCNFDPWYRYWVILYSDMDPYVVIKAGTKTVKTKVHENGGKAPKWNDTLTIKRES